MTERKAHTGRLRVVDHARPAAIEAQVERRETLGERAALLRVHAPEISLRLSPGMFVTARAWSGPDPLLRRPLAPFDVEITPAGTLIELLVVAGGRGTARIAGLEVGDTISLLGPLGRGFTPLDGKRASVLVAGGVGVAPLYHLLREAVRAGVEAPSVHVVLGAREARMLYGLDRFEALGVPVTVTTDRGDFGERGNVVEILERSLDGALSAREERPFVYGCGPEPMLQALVELCRRRGLEGEVSIERHMACGFGVCFTCACRVIGADGKPRRVRACLDGPVFPIARLAPEGW